jgi:hypothetical protein
MQNKNEHLVTQIVAKMQSISAHNLQILAEEMALIKFPTRFRDSGTFHRRGRNEEAQTTKGWPDAYVQTDPNIVDGVEATRSKTNWQGHLTEDLEKAKDGENYGLSGYFFVGGYPTAKALPSEITDFETEFTNLGIPRERVTILVGNDLVLELARPEYARIRHELLDLPSSPRILSALIPGVLVGDKLAEFQPNREDFRLGRVKQPALLESVVDDILSNGVCLVRGHGACGKTTLAQLLSCHEKIAPSPIYYVDLAKVDLSGVGGDIKNDVLTFSGKGVLFVVDNVHLDEGFAENLYEYWQGYAKSTGSRILFLGRERASAAGTPLGRLPARVLRAGHAELQGVVERIFARRNLPMPRITTECLNEWSKTFGGSRVRAELTVDLVAFSAAVQFRIASMQRGIFSLSASDAVAAIQEKYIQPIRSDAERENLFRIAALSDFEIALPSEALPHPECSFPVANKDLGLVLCETSSGHDPRRIFTLAHAALGGLILSAAGSKFNASRERIGIAGTFPSIGVRMVTRNAEGAQDPDIVAAIRVSLSNGSWVASCSTVDEWATLLRAIRTKKLADGIDLGRGLATAMRERILKGHCNIPALNRFVREAKRNALNEAIAVLYDVSDNEVFKALQNVICYARPDEIATFLQHHGEPEDLVRKLDIQKWNDAQANMPVYYLAEALAAMRNFEKWGRVDMALVPASQMIRSRDASLLRNINIGMLAHLLRISNLSLREKNDFLAWLDFIGSLEDIIRNSKRTHLSGALMSFFNHLDESLRRYFLSPSLEEKVFFEIGNAWQADPGNSLLKNTKKKIFGISLLGAYASFCGGLPPGSRLYWPDDVMVDDLLKTGLLGLQGEKLGMYELLFWLGLREYSRFGTGPTQVPGQFAEQFMQRLARSHPPGTKADATKQALLQWLEASKKRAWRLYA